MLKTINQLKAQLKSVKIIQGGMGVGISLWQLAAAVNKTGQLGVISCTMIRNIVFEQIKRGDKDILEAAAMFPDQKMVKRVLEFVAGVKNLPLAGYPSRKEVVELTILASFCHVHLAKRSGGMVGINLLTKVQFLIPAHLYGAMLAGVDVVIMGAGIPRQVPGILDKLWQHSACSYKIEYSGRKLAEDLVESFDPSDYVEDPPKIFRPLFFMIVSSVTLARRYMKIVNGFVFEGPTAGGHNAPPQDKEVGYTEHDTVNLSDLQFLVDLGIPFYMAGSYASPEGLAAALIGGAWGIQTGTIFLLSEESGLRPDKKSELIHDAFFGTLVVRTDKNASPTDFPFQVAERDDTASNPEVYKKRERACTKGDLRVVRIDENDKVVYLCKAEPIATLKRKLSPEELEGVHEYVCLCNELISTAGFGQDAGIITMGKDYSFIRYLIDSPHGTYKAEKAIRWLLGT